MNYQEYVSSGSIQLFVGLVILIYFIFRAFHLLNRKLVHNVNSGQKLQRVLYFVEFIAWLLFTIESIKYFSSTNTVVSVTLSVVLCVVMAWTAWFVIKDYTAGLYIRWNKLFLLNDEIEVDNVEGKIIEFKSRFVVLEIDPLHTVQIVYSKLFANNVVKLGLSGLSSNVSFTINLSSSLKPVDSLEKIKNYVYQLPWINSKHEPIVIIEEQNTEGSIIRINASLIDTNYSEKFKNSIRSKFE